MGYVVDGRLVVVANVDYGIMDGTCGGVNGRFDIS